MSPHSPAPPLPPPLQDSDLGDAETTELMTRQFQALMAGLQDEVPAVRATAITGTCIVLNLFWEMVPSATAAVFMNKLTGAGLLPGDARTGGSGGWRCSDMHWQDVL